MEWMPGTSGQVLHLGRPGGWRSVTNFGPGSMPLPAGNVIVSSAPLDGNELPADTTAWVLAPAGR
jgi:alpha-glucosidase